MRARTYGGLYVSLIFAEAAARRLYVNIGKRTCLSDGGAFSRPEFGVYTRGEKLKPNDISDEELWAL